MLAQSSDITVKEASGLPALAHDLVSLMRFHRSAAASRRMTSLWLSSGRRSAPRRSTNSRGSVILKRPRPLGWADQVSAFFGSVALIVS
jgi:hypothetical protein